MLLIYIILFLAVQKKKREAEAHETAIMLAKENDELKMKLKALIDDKIDSWVLNSNSIDDKEREFLVKLSTLTTRRYSCVDGGSRSAS